MKHIDWCRDWDFQQGEPSGFPMMKPQTVKVTLPHDAMIAGDTRADAKGGAETGFYEGSKISYTKYLEVTAEELAAQRFILSFDGCAGTMKLVVNGHTALRHHYSYSPFQADITSYLTAEGRNRVTVTVNNTDEPNSRWYSGTGLYRKVELLTAPAVHIAPNGLFVRLEQLENGTAFMKADVTIVNDGSEESAVDLSAHLRLHAAGSAHLSRKTDEEMEGREKSDASRTGSAWTDTGISGREIIPAGSTVTVTKSFTIGNAALWDIDDPQLYEIEVTAGEDSECAVFGVRTVTMDAQNGLQLNGKSLKLKGGCIHHDNGILGAAALRDAEYRKVSLLKENGFNAIRFAHNPVSSDMLNACDELGMLVIDEAFDVWNMEKNDFDFSQYFAEEGERELRNMILRDRNHPCVFLWSIGNEIPEQGGLSGGYETSRKLAAEVRSLDSTRAVGGALCSFFRGLSDADNDKYWASIMAHAEELRKNGMVNLDSEYGRSVFDSYTTPFVDGWDAIGYNYLRYQYEPTHAAHPDRVMICTESKPRELYEYWDDVKRLPYLIGDFEWTAVDYLGESGIANSFYVDAKDAAQTAMMMHRAQFPSRTAGAGDFDICGFEKPQLLYRRIVWGSKETAVVTHDPAHNGKVALLGRYSWGDVQHGYSWKDVKPGTEIHAEVYSSAPEVELFLNGTSVEKKTLEKGDHYRAEFEFAYEPGTLTAVSCDADGKEISRDEVRSTGTPAGLKLTLQNVHSNGSDTGDTEAAAEKGPVNAAAPMKADGQSLAFVTAEVVDEDGNRVPWAEEELHAEVNGAATLAGFGSGRSATIENYTTGTFTTFEGRALAVLRSSAEEGEATLTVRSEKLGEQALKISCV